MKSGDINNKSGIYTITNLINRKVYVGSAYNFKRRFKAHCSTLKNNIHRNKKLQNSYNKYGKDNFKFEILEECDIEFIYFKEYICINILNSCNSEYGYNINPGDPNNKPAINRMIGEKNYFYGKKGKLSPMFGKFKELHHNYGKKQNKTWIDNAANTRKKKVIQMDLQENFIKEWDSVKEAGETLNIPKSNISNCCNNKRKTACNFKWKYKNENIS